MTLSLPDSATRNRSNSGEDSGLPEHDRKRPRLSEGKSDAESHRPELQSSTHNTSPSQNPASNPKPSLPPRSTEVNMTTSSPTSKVTINTRPLSSQSINQIPPPATDGAVDPLPSIDIPQQNGNSATEAISIASSPARSPEIEIAEVEDYDQDPNQTKWTTRIGGGGASAPTIGRYHVWSTFPYARELNFGEARQALDGIYKILIDGSSDEIECLELVRRWFVDFAASCDALTDDIVGEDVAFWARAYSPVEGLLKREHKTGSSIPIEDMVTFFNAYADITKLVLQYEIRKLQELADSTSKLPKDFAITSWRWLMPTAWIIGAKVNLFESLRTYHDVDPMHIIKPFIDHVMDPSQLDVMATIIDLIAAIGAALPKHPKLYKELTLVFSALDQLLRLFSAGFNGTIMSSTEPMPQLENIKRGTETMLLRLDDILQLAIRKQHSWLTIENAQEIVNSLNKCIRLVACEDLRLARDVIKSANVQFEDDDLLYVNQTMQYAWKFTTLYKFIKHGRMELRVSGVETMSNDLVQVYYYHIQNDLNGHNDPLVKFLVRFLRGNEIINYIVSVDSHPNLVERAANLVGFLCVAKTYAESDTDRIWQIVEHGQDPRTIGAVLHLLQGCFNTFTVPDLNYICQKILDLPFHKIDRVRDFTSSLFNCIRQKSNNLTMLFDGRFDAVTRKLSLKLLREANTPSRCMTEYACVVRRDVLNYFTLFFHPSRAFAERLVIDEEEQAELFAQLRADIASHNEFACGSVLALNEIFGIHGLHPSTVIGIVDLCGCPDTLVENIAALSSDTSLTTGYTVEALQVQFESRLACLFSLLKYVPDRFSISLLETVWSSVFTADHLPETIKVYSWSQLTALMRQTKSPNPALELILREFWSKLRPVNFSKATLDFAKQSVIYESALRAADRTSTDDVITIPGIERVWTIMLECPPGTIEMEATDFVITQYLRNVVIVHSDKNAVHETHLALIDRCVSQVIGSAERLKSFADNGSQSDGDEGMVIVASEDEIKFEELKFDRSLLFLRCFTNALKKDPSASPISARQLEALPDYENKKGEVAEVSMKIQGSRYVKDVMFKISVGAENTGVELGDYISNITGWSQFTAIHAGQRVSLQEDASTLAELKLLDRMPLMISKSSRTTERLPRGYRASSPVDNKIMLHFDDLYALLESDNRLAKEVYDFLRTTSVREKVSEPIKKMSTPALDLLPSQKPYKLLFCTEALKACVEIEYFSKNPDTDFLRYAVHATTEAVMRVGAIGFADPLYMAATHEILETLSMACRIKVPTELSRSYFKDPEAFSEQITQCLQCALQVHANSVIHRDPEALIKIAFDVLIEACLHDGRTWPTLNANAAFRQVFCDCVLGDERETVRRCIVDIALALNGPMGAKITLKVSNPHATRVRFDTSVIEACLLHIWELLFPVLAMTANRPFHCQEVFDASLIILKIVGKSITVEDLQQMLTQWSDVLLKHEPYEIVGQAMQDRFIPGMTKLLCECARSLRVREELSPQGSLIQDLIVSFLFPPLSDSKMGLLTSRRPILDSLVRQPLYGLLLVLCQTSEENDMLRAEISNDFVVKNFFEPNLTHDRQALRTEVGYAGLRNLSNTCYLNSLLSQLFMHVQFRNLLLTASIVDGVKQKLLSELGKVFAYMQSSHEKAVDPSGAVESIVTYEGGEIDVTVQMDVDEFFNLLFDRLEGQMVDANTKVQFKSLYGGETIQQIKSKECEHVSERPESFAVLPVEIKGKSRLEESLKAYVEGEVLQGDNKYSCTSCERHVDAVKRNCLKEVPDNLIFNLKRFDFDILTGTRCKLNDFFQFPEELDMAPYTLEHLTHPDEPITPDVFELVGIIVHSGTADSGHYFSYIRQRPSARDKAHSWVQFNDSDVTPFDPSLIQDNCFGGVDASCYGMVKFYNAYMLFYQRKDSIKQTEEHFRHTDPVNPVRLPASPDLETHIAQQNELFLRSYCVQDENHARFVRELLGKLWTESGDHCSEEHAVEDRALKTTLEYVQQVSSRWKGQPEMEETLKVVLAFVDRCPRCAKSVCGWIVKEDAFPESMIKSPYAATRKAIWHLTKVSLESLHKQALDAPHTTDSYRDILDQVLNELARAWDFVLRFPRSWSEYFGLLNDILLLGDLETEVLMEFEFLEYCLEIIRLHTMDNHEVRNERRLRTRYVVYLNAREKSRLFNHAALIDFFAALFLRCDIHHPPRSSARGLSLPERRALGLDHMPYELSWLRKIIQSRHSPTAISTIIEHLAQDHEYAGPVSDVLSKGAEHKNMSVAVAFLDPILVFCRHGAHEPQIIDLVTAVLDGVQTISLEYGAEYLQFAKQLLEARNEMLELETGFLAEAMRSHIPDWASVLIVAPNEAHLDVRGGALEMIRQLLFVPMDTAQVEDPLKYRALLQIAVQLATKASSYARNAFISRSKDLAMQSGQVNELVTLVEKTFEWVEPGIFISQQRQNEITSLLTMLRLKNEHSVETLSPAEWQESSDLDAMSDQDFEDAHSP